MAARKKAAPKKAAATGQPKSPRRTASQARTERLARNSPSPTDSNVAYATEEPLTVADMSDDELRGHVDVMSRASQALVGQTVGKNRNRATIVSAADDMSPSAIAGRYARHMNVADNDARAATGNVESASNFYLPYNALWYHDHNQAIKEETAHTGVPLDRAIAASAVISPQNDPKLTELPGTRRIAEIAGGVDTSVNITPRAASHVTGIQTRSDARNKERQVNPVTVQPGPTSIDKLSSDQIAVLGSVSGATFHKDDPKKGVTLDQATQWGMVDDNNPFKAGQRAHPDLESLRRLGGVRNRQAVTRGLQFARGETTWDEEMRTPLGAGVEASRIDQPGKISAYSRTIAAADKFARDSEEYNHLVRLYGESNMQYKLPSSVGPPQDFWQKEAGLDIVYDKPNVGKPGATVWDNSIRKSKDVPMPDITPDNATLAVYGEGGRLANTGRGMQSLGSDQAIQWGVERETKERGQRKPPDLASEQSTSGFLEERRRIRAASGRSSNTPRSFGYRQYPALQARDVQIPGQMGFDI